VLSKIFFADIKHKKDSKRKGLGYYGLPVELGTEKELGITKEDIGKSISIEEYNELVKKP
jgi:isoleucyl-tRNA synthetase